MTGLAHARAARAASRPETIVFPGDARWDSARRAWNLAVDQRPAAVALPTSAAEVVAAVGYARTLGLRVAVQGTGHGAAAAPLDGTLLVNLAGLTGVELDVEARLARVAGGTVWAEVVDAAVAHGLTALHGSSRDVGVVGYTLGGGVGWLARRHGLASSSVVSARVVTADGELVRADAETNSDLFWALRGGGGGFGVVTELELELHPVATALAGWLAWPAERAVEVLSAWARWTRSAPDDVTSVGRVLQLPALPALPEALRGRRLVVVEAVHLGPERAGRELLRPLLDLEPELDTLRLVPARALTDLHRDPPGPVPGRGDGWLLDVLDDSVVRALVEAAAMDGTAPLVSVEVRHLGGALGRPDPNGGALTHLGAPYALVAVGPVTGAESVAALGRRLELLRRATAPWSSRHGYRNFAEPGRDAGAFHGGDVLERLLSIREARDPDGVFRPPDARD
jgi:FAD/FMN-containing dehydrogenase